jgi:hypothetical protein
MIVNSKQEKDLGVTWKLTGRGSYVAESSAIKAQGGSRKVCLPGSSLRIADLTWEPTKDVDGRVVCWRRTVEGKQLVILNTKEIKMTKTTKDTAPQAPERVEPKAPKTPKPITYSPSGEPVRAVKAGTKLALLIDLLARPEGATLEELATELSRTGSPVDVAGARSWLTYDLKRTNLGIVQPGDHLHLVGTPLPHKTAEPKKAPEAAIKIVESEPKMKKAAGSSKKRDRKREREARAAK